MNSGEKAIPPELDFRLTLHKQRTLPILPSGNGVCRRKGVVRVEWSCRNNGLVQQIPRGLRFVKLIEFVPPANWPNDLGSHFGAGQLARRKQKSSADNYLAPIVEFESED